MTGFYLRVKRGDRYENLDVSEMTDEELRSAFGDRDTKNLTGWVVALAGWIRDNVAEQQPSDPQEKKR